MSEIMEVNDLWNSDSFGNNFSFEDCMEWQDTFLKKYKAAVLRESPEQVNEILKKYIAHTKLQVRRILPAPVKASCMAKKLGYIIHIFHECRVGNQKISSSDFYDSMSEAIAMYCDLRISSLMNYQESFEDVQHAITSMLKVYLGNDHLHIVNTLLRIKRPKFSKSILEDTFKFVEEKAPFGMCKQSPITYCRYLLFYRQWKKLYTDINELKKLSRRGQTNLLEPPNFKNHPLFNKIRPRGIPVPNNMTLFFLTAQINTTAVVEIFFEYLKSQNIIDTENETPSEDVVEVIDLTDDPVKDEKNINNDIVIELTETFNNDVQIVSSNTSTNNAKANLNQPRARSSSQSTIDFDNSWSVPTSPADIISNKSPAPPMSSSTSKRSEDLRTLAKQSWSSSVRDHPTGTRTLETIERESTDTGICSDRSISDGFDNSPLYELETADKLVDLSCDCQHFPHSSHHNSCSRMKNVSSSTIAIDDEEVPSSINDTNNASSTNNSSAVLLNESDKIQSTININESTDTVKCSTCRKIQSVELVCSSTETSSTSSNHLIENQSKINDVQKAVQVDETNVCSSSSNGNNCNNNNGNALQKQVRSIAVSTDELEEFISSAVRSSSTHQTDDELVTQQNCGRESGTTTTSTTTNDDFTVATIDEMFCSDSVTLNYTRNNETQTKSTSSEEEKSASMESPTSSECDFHGFASEAISNHTHQNHEHDGGNKNNTKTVNCSMYLQNITAQTKGELLKRKSSNSHRKQVQLADSNEKIKKSIRFNDTAKSTNNTASYKSILKNSSSSSSSILKNKNFEKPKKIVVVSNNYYTRFIPNDDTVEEEEDDEHEVGGSSKTKYSSNGGRKFENVRKSGSIIISENHYDKPEDNQYYPDSYFIRRFEERRYEEGRSKEILSPRYRRCSFSDIRDYDPYVVDQNFDGSPNYYGIKSTQVHAQPVQRHHRSFPLNKLGLRRRTRSQERDMVQQHKNFFHDLMEERRLRKEKLYEERMHILYEQLRRKYGILKEIKVVLLREDLKRKALELRRQSIQNQNKEQKRRNYKKRNKPSNIDTMIPTNLSTTILHQQTIELTPKGKGRRGRPRKVKPVETSMDVLTTPPLQIVSRGTSEYCPTPTRTPTLPEFVESINGQKKRAAAAAAAINSTIDDSTQIKVPSIQNSIERLQNSLATSTSVLLPAEEKIATNTDSTIQCGNKRYNSIRSGSVRAQRQRVSNEVNKSKTGDQLPMLNNTHGDESQHQVLTNSENIELVDSSETILNRKEAVRPLRNCRNNRIFSSDTSSKRRQRKTEYFKRFRHVTGDIEDESTTNSTNSESIVQNANIQQVQTATVSSSVSQISSEESATATLNDDRTTNKISLSDQNNGSEQTEDTSESVSVISETCSKKKLLNHLLINGKRRKSVDTKDFVTNSKENERVTHCEKKSIQEIVNKLSKRRKLMIESNSDENLLSTENNIEKVIVNKTTDINGAHETTTNSEDNVKHCPENKMNIEENGDVKNKKNDSEDDYDDDDNRSLAQWLKIVQKPTETPLSVSNITFNILDLDQKTKISTYCDVSMVSHEEIINDDINDTDNNQSI